MSEIINKFFIKTEEVFLKQCQKKISKEVAVAISGGCDSLALTLLLHKFCLKNKIKLIAISVDHKMRKSSAQELRSLKKFLEAKKITHQILEIKNIPTKNIEAKLREERYFLLTEFCKKNKIEFLFLGHHLGDVAENFLIRLFRGSGLDGLSTISEISEINNIKLIRPLLDFTKDELKEFLQSQKITWFEDETNEDEKFLRNKIRKFLESFPEKNLIQKRIKNASDEISSVRKNFDEILKEEVEEVFISKKESIILNLEKFKNLNEKIALKALAINISNFTKSGYKPRLEKLKKLYYWILNDKFHKRRDFEGCFVEALKSKEKPAKEKPAKEKPIFLKITKKTSHADTIEA